MACPLPLFFRDEGLTGDVNSVDAGAVGFLLTVGFAPGAGDLETLIGTLRVLRPPKKSQAVGPS